MSVGTHCPDRPSVALRPALYDCFLPSVLPALRPSFLPSFFPSPPSCLPCCLPAFLHACGPACPSFYSDPAALLARRVSCAGLLVCLRDWLLGLLGIASHTSGGSQQGRDLRDRAASIERLEIRPSAVADPEGLRGVPGLHMDGCVRGGHSKGAPRPPERQRPGPRPAVAAKTASARSGVQHCARQQRPHARRSDDAPRAPPEPLSCGRGHRRQTVLADASMAADRRRTCTPTTPRSSSA